jgi:hypothetical protein
MWRFSDLGALKLYLGISVIIALRVVNNLLLAVEEVDVLVAFLPQTRS